MTISLLSVLAVVPLLTAAAPAPHSAREALGTTQPQGARTFADLRREIAQVAAPTALHVRIRWTTDAAVENPAHTGNRFDVVSVRAVRTRLRADRSPQISSTSLIVVSEDPTGRELDWRIVADPRIVRSEGASGPVLSGELLYYLQIDLRLLVPDLPDLARLSVYKVRPEGDVVLLDRVGVVELASPR